MENSIFNNPIFQGMPQDKLNFIMQFANKEKPKNMSQAMPFLMANMNLAKKQNIQFSHSEIQIIADLLCRDLPEQEQTKVKKIMSMLGHK